MAATTIIAEMTKEIKYDRKSGDYACYLGGELIGYESTYSAAETFINNTYYEMLAHASTPAEVPAQTTEPLPTVNELTWESEGSSYTDYYIDVGVARVVIGTYNDKPGVELIINGVGLNPELAEIITLADVRRLRDNLTALLSDARLLAIQAGARQLQTA